MSEYASHWLPTRQSLLSRLKNWDDQESWRDFFNTYWRLIYGVALRAGLTEQEAEDVVQETVVSVAKTISAYRRDSSVTFKGWLRHLTRCRIADQFRKRRRERLAEDCLDQADGGASSLDGVEDPASPVLDAVWDEEWRGNLIEAALDHLKLQVKKVSHYQAFYLNVIKEQPPSLVARNLGMNIAQVYLIRHRLTRLFKKALEKVEKNLD
jgi:RNA polymerase sigma factor (sigma-70 family)